MKDVFNIALLNYKNYKKISQNMMIVMTTASILVLMFLTIGKGLNKMSNSYNDDISLREIVVYQDNLEISDNDLKKIHKLSHVSNIYNSYYIYCNDDYQFSIDGVSFTGTGELLGIDSNYSSFSLSDIDKKNVNPILVGREFKQGDQNACIIDENYAYILGLNVEDIIGEKVDLFYGDIIIKDIHIIGVYSYQYGFFLNREDQMNDYMRNYYIETNKNVSPFLLSSDIIMSLSQSSISINYQHNDPLVYVDRANNVSGVCKNIQDLLGLSTINLIDIIEKKALLISNVERIIICIASILGFVAVVGMINSLIIKIDSKRTYTKMLYRLGYTKRKIKAIYLIENLLYGLKIIFISFIFCFLFSIALDMFMKNAYSQITSYKRFVFLIDIRFLLVYSVILLLIFYILSKIIVSNQIKGESYGK